MSSGRDTDSGFLQLTVELHYSGGYDDKRLSELSMKSSLFYNYYKTLRQ